MEVLENSENGWKICETLTKGRGLVATRDFEAGDLIFQDLPVLLGPRLKELCVGCHGAAPLTDCPKGCHLPVCSPACSDSPFHVAECNLLRNSLPGDIDGAWRTEITCCIVVLRCLFLSPEDKEFVASLQGHEGKIHGFEAKILKKYLGNSLSTEEESWLHKCCQVLDTNSFDVTNGKENSLAFINSRVSLRGLYRTASFMNHDCSPNTCLSFNEEGVMYVVSARPIRVGEEITTIYCTLLWNTPMRRAYILETKHFLCECDRCKDPTEFGTNLSAIACPLGTGFMLPSTPLSMHTSWQCNCCSQVLSPKQVAFLHMAQAVIMSRMDSSNPTTIGTFLMESEIPKSCQAAVALKLEAIQKLGHSEGFTWKELSEEMLNLKEELCKDVLKIMDCLQIGYCRSKGLVLLELHCVMCEKLKKFEYNETFQKDIWAELCNIITESQKIFNVQASAPKLLDQQIENHHLISSKIENLCR